MSIIQLSPLLRRVLLLDALSCVTLGLVMTVFADTLATFLQLPVALLREVGWLLIPLAAGIAYVASRERTARWLVWTVIVLNAVWVVQSCALLLSDWIAPNAGGYAFVMGQAALTALLAEVEYLGLRSSAISAA